jgi:hypothetical protein
MMPTDQDHRDLWRMIRSKIQHEESWIQQRVSWHLATNAFLFSAYAFVVVSAASRGSDLPPSVLLVMIPLVGVLFSSLVYLGVLAATRELKHILHEWRIFGPESAESEKLPAVHVGPSSLRLARFATTGISITAIAMWLILLALSVVMILRNVA